MWRFFSPYDDLKFTLQHLGTAHRETPFFKPFGIWCTRLSSDPSPVPKSLAQWSVGLNGGYARNILSIDREYADGQRYKPHNGFTLGVPVQYDFRSWFGLRTEFNFVQKGQSIHRTGYYEGQYTHTRNNFLQLPVMAHFSFGGEHLRGFIHMGGYVGYSGFPATVRVLRPS